eukprot:TRINITY_DN6492_c0_g1_i1.p1 TRINITY_DN6492_c0_g1~~TRINITY_DN6492_c0_g1_i1.p1  ORF type:complete len:128 (-),score=11.96 TRINITY_DN6492_c0_g1_i1:55-438(-)
MFGKEYPFLIDTNSVHQKCLKNELFNQHDVYSKVVLVSARAKNPVEGDTRTEISGSRKIRRGTTMETQTDTIEAFETKYGSPCIGVQWHPEAYYGYKDQTHLELINYMVLAGEAYIAKRSFLASFEL